MCAAFAVVFYIYNFSDLIFPNVSDGRPWSSAGSAAHRPRPAHSPDLRRRTMKWPSRRWQLVVPNNNTGPLIDVVSLFWRTTTLSRRRPHDQHRHDQRPPCTLLHPRCNLNHRSASSKGRQQNSERGWKRAVNLERKMWTSLSAPAPEISVGQGGDEQGERLVLIYLISTGNF